MEPRPILLPLGDRALIVRYAALLDLDANAAAVELAHRLENAGVPGVEEIAPNLVSVLVRYDPEKITWSRLASEIGLLAGVATTAHATTCEVVKIAIHYGGPNGPDLDTVAAQLSMTRSAFIAAHQSEPLRVLAIGFAPGFAYCGLHPPHLHIPRRQSVRTTVPPGSILFAAGQTAIAATAIPTGWSVIGRTQTLNFHSDTHPPTGLRAGDRVIFQSAP